MDEDLPPRLPFVSCLCPTYGRHKLLANALACFLAQDYPAGQRELIILDDAGDFPCQLEPGWKLVSIPTRFRSLPEKFNALAGIAQGDILVVWEDDDIYLPWHVSAHVTTLAGRGLSKRGFSKPSQVLSLYTGSLMAENAAGRFHASIAFTRDALEAAGGWPLTRRGDFDQQFMARLNAVAPAGDPCRSNPPSYVFRWGSTGAYHGQALMQSPADETWYARLEANGPAAVGRRLIPGFDVETQTVYADPTTRTKHSSG